MSVDELAVMDGWKCLLQIRGVRPFLSTRLPIRPGELYRNYDVSPEELTEFTG